MTHAVRSMGIAIILLISSVLLAGVIAQENNRQEPNVFGLVMDVQSGDGIPAKVFIGGPSSSFKAELETEGDGSFKLYVPAGEWIWEVEAEGYNPGRGEFRVGDAPVRLTMSLKMAENEPGEPEEPDRPEFNVGGMLVHAKTGEGIPGYIGFINPDGKALEMETEEDGEFRALLPPGPWLWKAGARGYKTQEGRLVIERVPVKLMIKMVPLENEEPQERFGTVYGHVMTPEGKPVPGAQIMIHPLMVRDPTELNIAADGTVRDVMPPEIEPIMVETDREGMFKIRLPFGEYFLMTNARGFHPSEMPIRVHPEMPEQRVEIVLNPMGPEPEIDWGRVKIVFQKEDQNSDGNPEMIKFAADLDGDGIHEIVYHMVDRNSDGIADSVEWVLDVPMEMWEKIMGMVMMLMEMSDSMEYPEEPPEWDGDWDNEWDRDGNPNTDDKPPIDPEMLKDLFEKEDDGRDPDTVSDTKDQNTDPSDEKDDSSGDLLDSDVSDKKSANDPTPVIEVAIAVAILLIAVLGLLVGGVYVRRKYTS